MLISIRVQNGGSIQVNVDRSPDRCPVWHSSIVAADMNVSFLFRTRVERVFQCPNTDCQILFIAKYDQIPQQGHNYKWKSSVPFEFLTTSHTETIESISADFCEIYTKSEKAEQQGLNLVAGPGYRKALEFLMKDYACMLEPDKKDTIERMLLGPCIAMYIKSDQIKAIARRAAWLGNDETHYVRKWADKDVNDLKKLISLTLHWVEPEKLSQDIIKGMPESGPTEVKRASPASVKDGMT